MCVTFIDRLAHLSSAASQVIDFVIKMVLFYHDFCVPLTWKTVSSWAESDVVVWDVRQRPAAFHQYHPMNLRKNWIYKLFMNNQINSWQPATEIKVISDSAGLQAGRRSHTACQIVIGVERMQANASIVKQEICRIQISINVWITKRCQAKNKNSNILSVIIKWTRLQRSRQQSL